MQRDCRIGETTVMTIGLLHPGEMGAAIAAALRASGQTLLWASAGRSAATAERADGAGLEDALAAEELSLSNEEIARLEEPYVPHEVSGIDL